MTAEDEIAAHCAEIDRCNQRGGRMLSVVDLIEAGTVPRELAGYALAAIGGGASFLVGANPGGAGKTTVMGALLNCVPRDVRLAPADGPAAIRDGLANPDPRRCFVCHEIGSGSWYAYLWGEELRAYFELPTAGHLLATNLHADTYDQVVEQVCGANGVPQEALRRMSLMFFLSVEGGLVRARRRIAAVWESDGRGPHRPIDPADAAGGRLASPAQVARAREIIDEFLARGIRTIRDVRAATLDIRDAGE